MTKKYKVYLRRDQCMGCGICSSLLEQEFSISHKDGLVNMKRAQKKGENLILEIDDNQLAEFEEAAAACPNLIIKISK